MKFPWSKTKVRYLVNETTLDGGRQTITVSKLTYDSHTFRAGDVIEVKGHFGPRVGGKPRVGDPVEGFASDAKDGHVEREDSVRHPASRIRTGDPLEGED